MSKQPKRDEKIGKYMRKIYDSLFIEIYNLLISIYSVIIIIFSLINSKARCRYQGQRRIFEIVKKKFPLKLKSKIIWFHCASLGEYEQAYPLIVKFRQNNFFIMLTFFSPSGYEIKKDCQDVDFVSYIPLDSKTNAKKFINLINPYMAIFVKSELWYNFISELNKRAINTILISAVFNKSYLNKLYYKKILKKISHIFIQDYNSMQICKSFNLSNYSMAGDTRIDSVFININTKYTNENIEKFIDGKFVFLAGSTWHKDEDIINKFIKLNPLPNTKFIIAPHSIETKRINELKKKIGKSILYSELDKKDNYKENILIINTIGILKYIYSYANLAYIGGGFIRSGIHNILEPSVYGVPAIFGPNYSKFPQAVDMVKSGLAFSIKSEQDLNDIYLKISKKPDIKQKITKYLESKSGATNIIFNFCKENFIL